MELFLDDNKLDADLCEFSQLFNDVIGGSAVESVEHDKKEAWGTATIKYSHGYGRNLTYNGIKSWAGLGMKGNKVLGFIVQFKPGTFSPSQKNSDTEMLDDDKFKKFCEKKNIKIIQDFILDVHAKERP